MWNGSSGEAQKRSANASAPPLGHASQYSLSFGPTSPSCGYIHHRSPMLKIVCTVLKNMLRQVSRQGGNRQSTKYLLRRGKEAPSWPCRPMGNKLMQQSMQPRSRAQTMGRHKRQHVVLSCRYVWQVCRSCERATLALPISPQ